jgi:hypothetical protein
MRSPLCTSRPLLAAVLCGVVVLLAGCGSGAHRTTSTRSARTPEASGPFRFFSSQSFWNEPLASDTPVDPHSATLVSALGAEVHREEVRGNGPWIDVTTDGVPVATVPSDQRPVSVKLDHPADPALSAAWRSVPLPSTARPSEGDNDLAVYQPSTDRMWEFFQLHQTSAGWEAEWGGAMEHVSANPGVYGPQAWPGAQSYWGVTAASLPLVAGAMTIQQLQAHDIDHALALTIPNTRAGVYASPAQRTDGKIDSASAIPEGARLRLDPHLNLAALHLPPLVRIIAQAAQRYGIVVRDTSGVVSFVAQDPLNRDFAVYRQLGQGRYPNQLLARFPWSHLQVVRMNLHTVRQ